jgi:hypothetical protein
MARAGSGKGRGKKAAAKKKSRKALASRATRPSRRGGSDNTVSRVVNMPRPDPSNIFEVDVSRKGASASVRAQIT